MQEWQSFGEASPEPNRRIRLKGYLRDNKDQPCEREDVFVDMNRQFASLSNVIDTHWQYME